MSGQSNDRGGKFYNQYLILPCMDISYCLVKSKNIQFVLVFPFLHIFSLMFTVMCILIADYHCDISRELYNMDQKSEEEANA